MIMKPLTEFCTLNMGQSPDSKTYNECGKGIPFYQGNADFGEIHPQTRVWCSAPVKIAEDGDILLSVRAPIGAMNVAIERCCIGRGLAALTPIHEKCSKQFLYYALQSKVDSLIAQGTGSTFKAISKKVLEATLIPAYSIEEQEQITMTFGHIDRNITVQRRQLTLLDQLVKSRFVEMFGDPTINPNGYPIKAMSEIAEYWNGLTYKPEDVSDEGTVVLRSSNIQNMQLDFVDIVRVKCKIGDKKYVQDNDILMCSRNGSAKLVGKVALIHGLTEPMSFGAFMMVVRSEYYPYLMTYFQLPAFRSQIATGATTTINQITGNMMNRVMLPVPDKETMNQFSAFVTQVDKSKFCIRKTLYMCRNWWTKLLHGGIMNMEFSTQRRRNK